MIQFIQKALHRFMPTIVTKQAGTIDQLRIGANDVVQKQTNDEILYRTYDEYSWVRACVDVIVRSTLSEGWDVVPNKMFEGTPSPGNKKRLLKFFSDINPQDTFEDLLEDAARDLLVLHNAYWEIVYDENDNDFSGEPQQLWTLDSVWMNVQANSNGLIKGYRLEIPGNQPVEFDKKEVIHWKIGGRGSSVYGNPRLLALVTPIEVDLSAQSYNKAFFKRGAKVRGAITMKGASKDQIERNRDFLKSIALKPAEAQGDLLLEGDVGYVKMGTEPNDMQFHELRAFVRDEVLAVFGCPPAKISLIETGNIGAGSGDSQDKTLYEETVRPLQRKISHRINKMIVVDGFGITDWIFEFNPQVINSKRQAEVDQIYVNIGVKGATEIRDELGLGPRTGPTTPGVDPTPPTDETTDENDLSRSLVTKQNELSQAEIEDFAPSRADPSINVQESAAAIKIEQTFERAIVRFFDRLTEQIISEVERVGLEELRASLGDMKIEQRFVWKDMGTNDRVVTEQKFYTFPAAVKNLRDYDNVTDIINASPMEQMLADNILEAADKGSELALQRLKSTLPAEVASAIKVTGISNKLVERINEYSADLANFLKGSLSGQVQAELLTGITAGDEIRVLTRRVRNAMDHPVPVKVRQPFIDSNGNPSIKLIDRKIPIQQHATIIARTETSRFMSEAAIDAFERTGLSPTVEFIMADDGCPLCEPFNERIFTLAEARGFIPVHHNCRCAWAPVVDETLLDNAEAAAEQ